MSTRDDESGRKRPHSDDAPPSQSNKQQARRSPAWKIFTPIPNSKFAKCNHCGIDITSASKSGTSGMMKHMERCKAYQKFQLSESNKKLSQDATSTEGNVVVVGGFCQTRCRRATVKMIVLDELPFSFVDNQGFRYFCSQAVPLYKVPSRRTITRDVLELFLSEKASLKGVLSGQRVSFTTDLWTSITMVSYMVITAHFIDENWKLHRKIISFSPISDHKGNTIAKQFEKSVIDWEIKKVFTITVDNASANDRAIRLLITKWKNTLGADGLILDGEFMHVRCAAHILNLIVGEGLKKVSKSVISIRNAVKYVRGSGSRLQAFQNKADEEKIGRGSLVLDCGTRWNSTYFMLSSALKFKPAFDRMAEEDKLYDAYFHEDDTFPMEVNESVTPTENKRIGPPSSKNWDDARVMVKFLQLFYESTLSFSASTKVTSNKCYGEICKIERVLKTYAEAEGPDTDLGLKKVAHIMKYDKFDKYWEGLEKINKLLFVAAVLDPRNKMGFVTHCFEKIYGQTLEGKKKCAAMKEMVESLLRKLYNAYNASYKSSLDLVNDINVNQAEGITIIDASSHGLDESFDLGDKSVNIGVEEDLFGEWSQMAKNKESDDASNELELYLLEKIWIPKDNNLGCTYNVLDWWRVNCVKYPVLALMAKNVLAIPVSTVSSESAFSTGGRILDEYRSCLSTSMVEALILTQNWLRSSPRFDVGVSLQEIMDENAFMDQVAEEMGKQSRNEE